MTIPNFDLIKTTLMGEMAGYFEIIGLGQSIQRKGNIYHEITEFYMVRVTAFYLYRQTEEKTCTIKIKIKIRGKLKK